MVRNWYCNRADIKYCFPWIRSFLDLLFCCCFLLFFMNQRIVLLKLTKSFLFVSLSLHHRKIFCAEKKYGEWDMALISISQITSLLFRSTSQSKPRLWKRRTTKESYSQVTDASQFQRPFDWQAEDWQLSGFLPVNQ